MGKFIEIIQPFLDRIKPLTDLIKRLASKCRTAVQPFFQQFTRLNSTKSPSANNIAGEANQPAEMVDTGPRPIKALKRKKVRPIRRHGRQRVYRLKGYTTVAKVNRKRQSEQQQRLLRRLLIGIIFILVIILLFNIYNPFRDLSEWYRILGIDEISDLADNVTSPSITGSTTTGAANTISATTK